MSNTFREIFRTDQRELLVEAAAFYEKHCRNQSAKHIDIANAKSCEKIKTWEHKERAMNTIIEILQEESF